MINQTALIHNYISLEPEAAYEGFIDPLEYIWYTFGLKIPSNKPTDGAILTLGDCVWYGYKEKQDERTEDKLIDERAA